MSPSSMRACGTDSGSASAASVIASASVGSAACPLARTRRWASASTWWRCQVAARRRPTSMTLGGLRRRSIPAWPARPCGAACDRTCAEHRGQLALPAEHLDGFGAPGVALLGQRAGFVFGLACFQGGLLGQRDRFDVGRFAGRGRPGTVWTARRCGLRSPRAATTTAPAVRLAMPTISRTGRLPRPVGRRRRSAARGAAARWASRRVLYSSEAATVIRCSGWPSSASQRCTPSASTVATLLEIATWVCRSGSPARESRCVNAAPISPWCRPGRPRWCRRG